LGGDHSRGCPGGLSPYSSAFDHGDLQSGLREPERNRAPYDTATHHYYIS
jgi:hypothetical protein